MNNEYIHEVLNSKTNTLDKPRTLNCLQRSMKYPLRCKDRKSRKIGYFDIFGTSHAFPIFPGYRTCLYKKNYCPFTSIPRGT